LGQKRKSKQQSKDQHVLGRAATKKNFRTSSKEQSEENSRYNHKVTNLRLREGGRAIWNGYSWVDFDLIFSVYTSRRRVDLFSRSSRGTKISSDKDKANCGNKDIHGSIYVVEREKLIRYEPIKPNDSSLFKPLNDYLTGSIPLP
jgi:hypothetical protein